LTLALVDLRADEYKGLVFFLSRRDTINQHVIDRFPEGLPMSEDQSFVDFLRRIRAGDQDAAAELLRLYEPAIRLEVRRRLNDPSLYPLLGSMDICQSVPVTIPDPRLVPLDHQTAHELTALRAEVERRLAAQKP
jgi:hypothetical protein